MAVVITSQLYDELLREAERAAPQECCGLLLGEVDHITTIQPADNISDMPESRFLIDPAILAKAQREAREGGPAILGYYHSHPNGRAEPSVRDRAQAMPDGRIWAIIAQGKIRFWRAVADTANPACTAFAEHHVSIV